VDPERLRKQFPELNNEDLQAYVNVTRQVLADPAGRGRAMAALLGQARAAREKQAAGTSLEPGEALALRYLNAVEKMQGRTRSGD
jgi:hypothetical protein